MGCVVQVRQRAVVPNSLFVWMMRVHGRRHALKFAYMQHATLLHAACYTFACRFMHTSGLRVCLCMQGWVPAVVCLVGDCISFTAAAVPVYGSPIRF